MNQKKQIMCDDLDKMAETCVSRRTAVAMLGLLAGSALGQEQIDEEALRAATEKSREQAAKLRRKGQEQAFQRNLERHPEMRAFYERVGSDATIEERMRAMQDWQRERIMENLKQRLEVSEEEWKVVQPRLDMVFFLRNPPMSFAPEDICASALVHRLTAELQQLVNTKGTKPEEIKAKLTALRAAKERVRHELSRAQQNLRQIMTIRQEAVLVLNQLLD